jgi:hypothetical protein
MGSTYNYGVPQVFEKQHLLTPTVEHGSTAALFPNVNSSFFLKKKFKKHCK